MFDRPRSYSLTSGGIQAMAPAASYESGARKASEEPPPELDVASVSLRREADGVQVVVRLRRLPRPGLVASYRIALKHMRGEARRCAVSPRAVFAAPWLRSLPAGAPLSLTIQSYNQRGHLLERAVMTAVLED